MLYAICENGGLETEYVRHERFESYREARYAMQELVEQEQEWADPDYPGADIHGDPLCKFDVVRVLDDGSITTEI